MKLCHAFIRVGQELPASWRIVHIASETEGTSLHVWYYVEDPPPPPPPPPPPSGTKQRASLEVRDGRPMTWGD